MKKRMLPLLALSTPLFLAGCGDEDGQAEENKEIELVYVAWESEIASNNVIKEALEQAGYDVTLTLVEQSIMWSSVANQEADGFVAGWLPDDMRADYEQYGDEMVDLGANLEGAQTGLAVPTYMDIDSIEELSSDVVEEITGIDAGAGVVIATEEVLDAYDIDDVALSTSSDAFMTAELDSRYNAEEPVVVTAWQPHWKFNSYDLKFLEDPQGIYAEDGEIRTLVREGLEEDDPTAYQILDNFSWTPEDMNAVMLYVEEEGMEPEEAAAKWVEDNQETVDEWINVDE
ncbi:glycine betaine ABC transporter substrate-binding protein [Shouchella shacheensis]|uniref:glycine betaine ABC transporter substrate-binding protein n=1 Tax=Shouchella shacheensis TaxID=1649580 RepID=UPI000B1202C0|nr:glycine betaine ABC transporter substrate-binding protein [Shouchella shacheensis]